MYSASDLRKGLRIQIDGAPYIITDFNFMKPGKGASIYNCKMKNLITGTTLSKSYRSNDKIEEPKIEDRKMRYSYYDGENYVFLDSNFEQIEIAPDVLDDQRYFLNEDMPVEVLLFNGQAIGIDLPTFVEKEIVETEPGARGNTATNVLKPAKIEGDFEIQVPLFINQGDIVKIDTRTGEYSDRVRSARI